MAGFIGRDFFIKKAGVELLGLRAKDLTYGGESIDITTGEDDGFRTLLSESGTKSLDISFDGIAKDALIRDLTLGDGVVLLTDVELEWPLSPSGTVPATTTGNFRINGYSEGHPYNEATTFSSTLESSGAWVYTPES
jgi:predicted secreted protein|tara:strand:- start:594 stop:1004 length:411 start_codon:yes stop_codon:yes gene_type:complete